jgi:hypothetical protein
MRARQAMRDTSRESRDVPCGMTLEDFDAAAMIHVANRKNAL